MNKQNLENLSSMVEEVDTCNTYFSNHVGHHKEEYIRKGIILIEIIAILSLLFLF